MAEFDRLLGLDRIKAFHLNDSRRERGSRIDRHEHIGRGELGLEPFRLLLADPRFRRCPHVLGDAQGGGKRRRLGRDQSADATHAVLT